MKNKMNKIIVLISFFAFSSVILARTQDEEIMRAMRDEINRSMKELKLDKLQKPYFIEYILHIKSDYNILSKLGAIVQKDVSGAKTAYLTTRVRVGDYKFDNTGFVDVSSSFFGSTTDDDNEPYENRRITSYLDYNTLRRELWLATDAAYKEAAENFSKKEARLKNIVRRDTTWSFTKVQARQAVDTFAIPTFDATKYIDLVNSASEVFVNYPSISGSLSQIKYVPETTYYVNSEGMEYIKNAGYCKFDVMGVAQRKDGMTVADAYSTICNYPNSKSFPTKDSILKATNAIAKNIEVMLKAKVLEDTYNGPILFSDEAACDLIAQNFANNLMAQKTSRMSKGWSLSSGSENTTRAFQTKVGARVLPRFISMKDLPLTKKFQDVDLAGTYSIDDDGLSPKDILIIDKGYLKTLFSDRTPIKRVRKSNAHKRDGAPCYSNLQMIVDKKHQKDEKALKAKLLKLCKARELPFGIIVKKVINKGLVTGKNSLYNLAKGSLDYPRGNVLVSYSIFKIYPDGREEPVVGGALVGFSPSLFKEILNTGKKLYVQNLLTSVASSFFSSSSTPVSIIAPALLFEEGELRLIEKDYQKPKILTNPLLER